MPKKSSYIDQENQVVFAFEISPRSQAPTINIRSNVVSIEERIYANKLQSKVNTFDRLLEFSRKLP